MIDRSLSARFEARVAKEDEQSLGWLGLIAVEGSLSLDLLGKHQVGSAWLQGAISSGLLVRTRVLGSFEVSVHPDFEELTLRRLAEAGRLSRLCDLGHALVGRRSVSELTRALQAGDLGAFLRHHAAVERHRPADLRASAEWVRASLCAPFDPDWFTRVYAARAPRAALVALRESLERGEPHGGLTEWLHALVSDPDFADNDVRAEASNLLSQHAIASGALHGLAALGRDLDAHTRVGFKALADWIAGSNTDNAESQSLELAFKGGLPRCGSVTPIFALLLEGRRAKADSALVKRLLATAKTDAERGAARALRSLKRYATETRGSPRRIDFHQLPKTAGLWEILLVGATVDLHLEQTVTRAVWARGLADMAIRLRRSGFDWLARQAFALARRLDANHASTQLAAAELDAASLELPVDAPRLWDLLTRTPEWQRTLHALEHLTETDPEPFAPKERAVWFIDMKDGNLSRPALQEFRTPGGWSQGRRVSLAELFAIRERLPREDRRVLEETRETTRGTTVTREATPEIFEALIGHPRVVNGAHGMLPIDVVRADCHIETIDDEDVIRVEVVPRGAALGINVAPRGDDRLEVTRVSPTMQRVIDLLPRGMEVPKADEPGLLRVLEKLAARIEVRSPHLGVERTVEPDAFPCVRVVPITGAWQVQIGVRPFHDKGRFFVAGLGPPTLTLSIEGQRLRCQRDLALERAHRDALVESAPSLAAAQDAGADDSPFDGEDRWTFGLEAMLVLLQELRASDVRHSLEWPESTALDVRGTVSTKNLHVRLRSKKGWYIATGGVSLDDVTSVRLEELARAPMTPRGRFLRLPSGDYVELEEKIRRLLLSLAAVGAARHQRQPGIAVHRSAIASVFDAARSASTVDVDHETTDWIAELRRSTVPSTPAPAELCATLRPYQLDGFRWLASLADLGIGACLADDMGLGKTVQILALLLHRRAHGPALVVAPTSVLSNWVLEMLRFAPTLKALEYHGEKRNLEQARRSGEGLVVVTSYAILQQDIDALADIEWSTAVLDEAQFIKNPESLRARAAHRLTAKHRVVATGTPVENHFGDLFSIFQFLNPGMLGDWADFRRRFVLPVEREGDITPGAALRALVEPFLLRRTKREVLAELPPVTEIRQDLHLSQGDALRYGLLRKQIHEKLFTPYGRAQNKIEVFAELTRLRRFCCHPRLVFPDADTDSVKIRALLSLIEELRENGHRALVFSQYVDFLGLVREHLDERRISYEYLDGATPRAERQVRIDAFQAGRSDLFLISLKAGGFGLNLTAADYVVHLDPWWNPAVEAQATDRAHRIGQTRPVTIYRLVTKNTIEEKIVELHEAKRRIARAILESEPDVELTNEELRNLLEDSTPAEPDFPRLGLRQ